MCQRRLGEDAHQADRTAAIDETHAIFCENFAELTGRFAENRLGPCIRSAIDANRIDFAHGLILIEEYMWRRFSLPASAFYPEWPRAMRLARTEGFIKTAMRAAVFPQQLFALER